MDLIRVGALLHNLEDNTSFNLILKKLIDFTFATKGEIELSINQIIDNLSSDGGIYMSFSQTDILTCCREFDNIFYITGNKDHESVRISEEYLETIRNKINAIGLDKMIQRFYDEILDKKKKKTHKHEKIAEAIYLFLYNVLIESEIEYSKLFSIDTKEVARIIRRIEYADIVNDFIQWEDDQKNSILYALYGAGLEFSILSVKKDLVNISAFQNKTLYLDTNVLFRLTGLNGTDLAQRTSDFINRFKKLGMKIKISSLTKKEFDDTIKQKIAFIVENMQNSSKYTINNFERLDRNNYSIFQYYLDWKKSIPNVRITSLSPYIHTQLNKVISQFDISLESKMDKSLVSSEELSAQIDTYKNLRYHNRKSDKLIENDMKNYCYMLALRQKLCIKDYSSVDYYLLTVDYELIHFDNNCKENFRVVFHPARLYSIILRFCGRITTTELMSFIRLLKVDIKTEERLSETTRLIINDHLNFYEADESLQQPYIDALIESQMLEQIDNAEITHKRSMIHEVFEKVSKNKAIEMEKELIINRQTIETLSKDIESEKSKNTKKGLFFGLAKVILLILLFYITYRICYLFLDELDNIAISTTVSLAGFYLLFRSKTSIIDNSNDKNNNNNSS